MKRPFFFEARRAAVGAVLTLATGACSTEEPPTDCGDDSMAIVTFQGHSSAAEDDVRMCIDIHAASRLDATATSAGRDESYATTRPGVIPWTDVRFEQAVEACGRAGKFLCDADSLRAIAPIDGWWADGTIRFDETAIDALVPTSDDKRVAHRFDPLNPFDMVVAGDTGKPPFPDALGQVAYWAVSPPTDDNARDPSIPLVLGRLESDYVVSGFLRVAPVLEETFKHPLLGFRCCIDARMREAFTTLSKDPNRKRKEEPDVPIAEQ